MEKILNYGQFMMLIAGLFLVSSALVLMLPLALWSVLGVNTLAHDIAFMARAQTPWLVSMGILAFLLKEREVSDTDARAYLLALLIGCCLAFILAVYASVTGILSGFGWFAVVLFLGIAGISGLFLRDEYPAGFV